MRKTITTLILAAAALGTAAVLADAGPADAATINEAGNGFVGKGEVQSAYG